MVSKYWVGENIMKFELHIRLISLLILVLAFFACKKSFEPINASFDQNLVGDWISFYENPPFPFPSISGIKITNNGEVFSLSIKTETGCLIKSSNKALAKYSFVSNGILIYERYNKGLVNSSKYKQYYKIENDTLFLSVNYDINSIVKKPDYSYFYIHSKIGQQVAQPINVTFEAILNNTFIYNIPINPYPSAYSYFDDKSLNIIALINNCGHLHFKLFKFTGIGNYDLNSSFASYSEGCGCLIAYIDTEIDSSKFTIEITAYDGTRIVGNFDLKFEQIHFRKGKFSIPVFKD